MDYYFRHLTKRDRSEEADRHLAFVLTFVAGAANAGGFMAVQQYTSHMSGIVSAMADNIVLGDLSLVAGGLGAFLSFVAGAGVSAILVNWGRRLKLHSEYAFPLVLEALLLALFGALGPLLQHNVWFFVPSTVMLLCFIMGLQNAIITKLSKSRIRTTHVTGITTDIGIELGKLLYINVSKDAEPVRADRPKLWLLSVLCGMFFVGGIVGAVCFKQAGFSFAYILSLVIFTIAILPVTDDIRALFQKN
ncbi:DUF1275 domain-containing protein [Phreatobacter aquaticus]|uniref:DUF1275 domain-containing protein n=1 Tax=Phreatobacter aquaticus TaxID=2570229 RepID=A0A4D7QIY4_9HYPH|nr:DUF1275 domain-containing protein [Phreatobacter aquaticus]